MLKSNRANYLLLGPMLTLGPMPTLGPKGPAALQQNRIAQDCTPENMFSGYNLYAITICHIL